MQKWTINHNPCLKYFWYAPCDSCYSGAHACKFDGGHKSVCVCAQCDAIGTRKLLLAKLDTLNSAISFKRSLPSR